jgi:uncharacterized protein YndB with AHSA1/START domain
MDGILELGLIAFSLAWAAELLFSRNKTVACLTDAAKVQLGGCAMNDVVNTDRIEKRIQLEASRERVWRAVTDSQEFGTWFKCALEGPFQVGKPIKGRITHPGYEHLTFEWLVDRMDAPSVFAYRWHPYAVDPKVDYSGEETTRVEFRLEEKDGGTLLTVTESGFDKIPAARRAEAVRMNDGGWTAQMKNIEAYLAK